jgi:hemerythrin-like domain-containing protein
MSEGISAVKDIRNFVLNLQNNVDQSKEENLLLNDKINSLNSEKQELVEITNQLKEQIKMLKLAKQIDGDEVKENKDVKLMINEMVREIDKCIALLNK